MTFIPLEFGLINIAIQTKHENGQVSPRHLDIVDFVTAVDVMKKLKTHVVEDKFIEAEEEFSTAEKALILKLIERPWTLGEAETYLSLKAKLV